MHKNKATVTHVLIHLFLNYVKQEVKVFWFQL